jgi:hypothetical protein
MAAKASVLPSPYRGPELVSFERETVPSAGEAETRSASISEGLRLAQGFLNAIDFEVTAIDFEVEAARSLYGAWHAQHQGEIYLIRTLDRISEHLRALQAIQAELGEPGKNARRTGAAANSPGR